MFLKNEHTYGATFRVACMRSETERVCFLLYHTYARGRVWLPEESVIQLHTGDFSLSLELISGVTLEGDGIPRLSTIPVAGAVLRQAWVIAGGRDGCCGTKAIPGQTVDTGSPRLHG